MLLEPLDWFFMLCDVTGFSAAAHHFIGGQLNAPVTIRGYLTMTTLAEADAAVDALIQEYLDSALIDPEAVEGMTREEIAYAFYQASQEQTAWLTDAWNEQERLLTKVSTDPSATHEDFAALRALEEDIRSATENAERLGTQTSQSRNLILAFNRMYEPPQSPYGELLLFVLSFTPLDQYISAFDLARSVADEDWLGAGLSLADLITPGRLRAAASGLRGQGDEVGGGLGHLVGDGANGGWQPAYAGAGAGGGTGSTRGNTHFFLEGHGRPSSGGVTYAPDERGFSNLGPGRRTSSITTSDGETLEVIINSEHAFDRPHTIPGTGGQTSAFSRTQLTQDQVENAILDDVSQQLTQGLVLPVPNSTNSASSFYNGTIAVEGLRIGYHAVQTQDGKIRISTYYLTQPN